MIHAGSAFARPKRRDAEGRRVLTVLLNAGVGFHKSCCGGPGYRPRTWGEVRERMTWARRTGEPPHRSLLRPELPRRLAVDGLAGRVSWRPAVVSARGAGRCDGRGVG